MQHRERERERELKEASKPCRPSWSLSTLFAFCFRRNSIRTPLHKYTNTHTRTRFRRRYRIMCVLPKTLGISALSPCLCSFHRSHGRSHAVDNMDVHGCTSSVVVHYIDDDDDAHQCAPTRMLTDLQPAASSISSKNVL
jgi:hypothetical protein